MITLLNTSIVTADGTYEMKSISLTEALALIEDQEINSAVGHQATADILTELLGVDVPMNRQFYQQNAGDVALVFKLSGRPEEGKILTKDEIEETGYTFKKLTRLA